MIPKKIHYCWLGGAKKPELAEKCIASWEKICPDYEIIEWNESNLDISSFPLYTRQAYEAKKWGFVPDYIRCWLVYTYGGIYLDTDVEVIKNFDDLLDKPAFLGFEGANVNLGSGFGAEAGNPLLLAIMKDYEERPFIKPDGSLDLTPSPALNSEVLKQHGVALNNKYQEIPGVAAIYPAEYFCPIDYYTGELKATENTYSIHHYMASWMSKKQRKADIKKGKIWKNGDLKKDYADVKAERGVFYASLWYLKQKLKGR